MTTLVSLLPNKHKTQTYMLEAPDSEVRQGKPFLPKAVRTSRIIAIEKKTSSKGNDMLVVRFEIVAPESEKIGAATVKIGGLQFTDWMVYGNDMGKAKVQALTKACRGVFPIDMENPATVRSTYLGKAIRAEITSEEKPLTQFNVELNSDEPVKDDEGNVVVDINYRLGRIIGGEDKYSIAADMVPVKS